MFHYLRQPSGKAEALVAGKWNRQILYKICILCKVRELPGQRCIPAARRCPSHITGWKAWKLLLVRKRPIPIGPFGVPKALWHFTKESNGDPGWGRQGERKGTKDHLTLAVKQTHLSLPLGETHEEPSSFWTHQASTAPVLGEIS